MNTEEMLCLIAMEECTEIAQRISKASRFGFSGIEPGQIEPNYIRIRNEILDLAVIIQMLESKLGVDIWTDTSKNPEGARLKQQKVEIYMNYSKQLRRLE